ncbi:MAG: hypothetical protein ABIT07_04275 [Ferruginibacter sp.]
MKMLKGIAIIFLCLFISITLLSLLIPSNVRTVNSVVIHADKNKIFNQIADFSNWKNWHPVFQNDSNAFYSNPSFGVNANVKWVTSGKTNELLITKSTAQEITILQLRPGEKEVVHILSIVPNKGSPALQVEWNVLTKLKWYPWEKFRGIFIDKIAGPGYEASLNNLKALLEEKN